MKKKILSLISLVFMMFFASSTVYATSVTNAGSIINEEGTYDSIRLVAANQITSSATVDGIYFLAGNDLSFEGNATYGMFAGNTITVKGNIEKDLLVAGNKIDITADTVIGRDAYLAGSQIYLKTNIPRDLRAGGSIIDLSNVTIGGDAYLDADRIIFNENTVITGKLTYFDNAKTESLDKATIGEIVTKKYDKVVVEYSFKEKVYSFIVSAIAAFITMLLLLYLLPKVEERLTKVDLKFANIAKTTCIGFLILFIVPIVAIIALLTGILTPASIILLALYGISMYVSNLVVYYIVGHVFNKKVFKKEDKYLSLAYGIIIVKLLKLIPVVGGYINALALFYGLGLIYYYIKNRDQR